MSDSIIVNPHKLVGDMERLSVIKEHLKGKFLKDVNLLNHIGYFCHDPKKAKQIKDPQSFTEIVRVNNERVEMRYTVHPVPSFGYPSVTAFNLCDFIDRLLSYHGRPAMNPIPFDMASLREALNLKKTGQNNDTIRTALKQLRSTTIETSHFFLDRNRRKWLETTYTFFDDLVFVGESKNNIKGGLIYLNKHLIMSFNSKNQMPINIERYGDLPSVSKVIYLKLFRQFSAARKAGKPSVQISIENDYNALCKVLGITPQKYKSRIEQQLKPHFLQLQDVKKLIRSWGISKQKTKDGYKVTSEPGQGYDEDFDTYNKKKEVDQLKLEFKERDKKNVPEVEAVMYFQEKLFGIIPDIKEPTHINDKDTAFAKKVLKIFPGKNIHKFIDYGVQEAEATNFPIKTFRGLEGFINAFKAIDIKSKKNKAIEKVQKDTQNKDEEAKALYILFIDETYNNYLESLGPKKRKNHEQGIQNEVEGNALCRGKNKNSPIYIGFKDNLIRTFTETNLINDKESEFRDFLKKQDKNHLLDVKLKDLRLT